jgi:hypothetical protein
MSEYSLGFHTDISNEDYHALTELGGKPCVSSSYYKNYYNKTALHAELGGTTISPAAAATGTAVHYMTLEPELDMVVRGPETRRGKVWSEAVDAAEAAGKLLLTAGDFDQCEAMAQALLDNPQCGKILKDKQRVCEGSIFVEHDSGAVMKARPDLWIERTGVMADVKTALDASPAGFTKSAFKFGYDFQAAWYRMCARKVGWDVKYFAFLVVEKGPPHAALLHIFGNEAMSRAERLIDFHLPDIARVKDSGEFSTGWPPFNVMHLPEWLSEES